MRSGLSSDFYLRAEVALRRLPGVSAVGMSNSLPPDGWHDGMRYAEIFVTGKPPNPQGIGGDVVTRTVTPEYFRALRIPMLKGPGFTEEERYVPSSIDVSPELRGQFVTY